MTTLCEGRHGEVRSVQCPLWRLCGATTIHVYTTSTEASSKPGIAANILNFRPQPHGPHRAKGFRAGKSGVVGGLRLERHS